MKKRRIFISSVQKEFAGERAALREYLHADPLLRRFFEVFLFEDLPASDRRTDAVYLGEYIERMGAGTGDMIRRCREAGLPEPIFQITDGFTLTIPRLTATVTTTPSVGLGEKLGEKLGETRATIMKAMRDNPRVTVTKLAEILGISTTAVEKNIQYLKSQGYVKRHGPAKGGHWEVLE